MATWERLGPLTDAKIRQLSTAHGAEFIPIDDTVHVKKGEKDGMIYQSWVKKDS